MTRFPFYFVFILVFVSGCKKEPKCPFISCKIDGVYWESQYRAAEFLGTESPYSTTERIPDGLVWSFRGSRINDVLLTSSAFVIEFRLSKIGGPVDSLLSIGHVPEGSGEYYSGTNEIMVGQLVFENGGYTHKGTFSGDIIRPADPQRDADTLTITEGKFEGR
jgi:hypothetical protein